jgi:hypothetical protein
VNRFAIVKLSLVYICVFAVSSLPQTTSAYYSGPRWPSTFLVGYSIDPQLDAKLNVTGSTTKINSAASKWNKASNLVAYSTTYANGIPISAKDFSVADPCNPLLGPSTDYARVCPVSVINNGNDIVSLSMFFNNGSRVAWNTSGSINCGSTPRQMDFSTAVIHEFGHLFQLKDYSPFAPNFDAVMAFNCKKTQPTRR